jgi:hypothetical protein
VQSQTIVGLQSSVLLHSAKDAAAPIPSYPSGYLDNVPDSGRYSRIAPLSEFDAAEPVLLTSGELEVDGGIEAADVKRGQV